MTSMVRANPREIEGPFAGVSRDWLPAALLWLTTALLVLARQGIVLTVVFPILATSVGLWLYFRSPARYVGFVWWLWFLSPEVRRLADWSIGAYTPVNPIQMAPIAVAMISFFTVLRHRGIFAQQRGLPVLLISLGLVYAYVVGIVKNGTFAATYELANWLYPIMVGFHVMAHTRQYPAIRDSIVHTFVGGTLVMGAYGLVQFFIMPPWDALWMTGSGMESMGEPVPMGVRVCSTMNSSGPFAVTMMGAMVLVMAARSRVRWIAGAVGFFSFGLTLQRSAWAGWTIALLIQLLQSSSKVRLRIIGTAVLVVGIGAALVTVGPVGDKLQTRIQTIGRLGDDQSYQDHVEFYTTFAEKAFTDISGEGFGATGGSTKLASKEGSLGKYGNFDSGLMNIAFVLGWPGMLLHLSGTLWLFARAVRASLRMRDDQFVSGCMSLAFTHVAMLVFTNTLQGTSGLLLSTCVFSILSAMHWKKQKRRKATLLMGASH
jgi:hypothetical protein